MLEKVKQRRCTSHGKDCNCPYRFVLKRQRMSTGVNGQTVHVPGERIRVALRTYFPDQRLRGKGTWTQAMSLHGQFVTDVDRTGRYYDWSEKRKGRLVTRGLTWGGLVDHYVNAYAAPKRVEEDGTFARALQYRYDKIK